jgi:hypothetical protein
MFRRATGYAGIGIAATGAAIALAAGPAAAAAPGAVWNMNETSGTTMVDSSGNGNNGTTYNVGLTGAGYSFNGSTSKVVVPSSSTLNPGTNNFSYSVRVQTSRVPPSGTDYDLIRKGTSSTTGGEYKLEIVYSNGMGKAFCLVKDAGKVSATVKGTANVADGHPHTITCTKTATGLTVNDGTTARTKTFTTAVGSISSTAPLTLSAKTPTITGPAGDWYTGLMINASVSIG